MFQEPNIIASNVFGLAEVNSEKGFIGLTEEAIQRLNGCRKLFFVMGTGITGVGKSTKLSQLINPDFKEFSTNQQKKFVFKAKDGPNPVTGSERDNMNFPSFGPIKLSSFCERWNIETREEDDEIGLVFVDSQGTHAIKEKGEGLASSTAILSTGVGLRLCFAGSNRPTKYNFNEIDGALSLNLMITRREQQTFGYSFGIIYNDMFSKTKEEEDQTRIEKSNEDYRQIWIEHNEKLDTPNGFRLWLLENPYVNIEGYWESMKEIAMWITELARLKRRNFHSFVEITKAASEFLEDIKSEGIKFDDNLDVDMTSNLNMILYGELQQIVEDMKDFIDQTSKKLVDEAEESQIFDQKEGYLKEQHYQIIKKEFKDKIEIFWGDFENEFPDIYNYYLPILEKISNESIDNNKIIRIKEIIYTTKNKIIEERDKIICKQEKESKKDISKISKEEIFDKNIIDVEIMKIVGKALNEFETNIERICKYKSVREEETINNIIEQSKYQIDMQMKIILQGMIDERINQTITENFNAKINEMNEEKRKMEEENKKEMDNLEKKQSEQIQMLKEKYNEHIKSLEEETRKLNSNIEELQKKQRELDQQRTKQEEENKAEIEKERQKHQSDIERILKEQEKAQESRGQAIQNQMNQLREQHRKELKELKDKLAAKEKEEQERIIQKKQEEKRQKEIIEKRIRKGSKVKVKPFSKDYDHKIILDGWVYQNYIFTVGEVAGDRVVIWKNPSCTGNPTAAFAANNLILV